MRVSIIVPVYNVEEYLVKCLISLTKLKSVDYEVILVDDGSTDKSGQICDDFTANNLNFSVFHLKNSGVSNARNFGIEKATGDYCMFVDSDDFVSPDILQKMIEASDDGKIDMVQCNFVRTQNTKEEIVGITQETVFDGGENALEKLFEPTKIIANSVCAKIYKKEICKKIRFDSKIRIAEDLKYNFDYLLETKTIKLIPFGGYYYVKRDGSAMESGFSEKKLDDIIVNEYMLSKIKSEDLIKKIESRNLVTMIKLLYAIEKEEVINHSFHKDVKNKLINKIAFSKQPYYISIKYKILRLFIKLLPRTTLKIFKIYIQIKNKK